MSADITKTIAKVNSFIRLLQIVAGIPHVFTNGFHIEWYGISMYVYDDYDEKTNDPIPGTAKANMANTVRTIRRAIPGATTEKGANDYYFWVDVNLPETDMKIRIHASREKVCEKVIVGQKETIEIDYDKAPKKTVMVDIVEWNCGNLLEGVE